MSIMPSRRAFAEAGEEAGLAQHGFLHERVARADRDAMAAGNAARFADGRAAIPQHARMRILPADGERLIHLQVLARLDAAAAQNALVRIVAVKRIACCRPRTAWA